MQEKFELFTKGAIAHKRLTLGVIVGMSIVGGTVLAMSTSDTNSHVANKVTMNDAPDIAIAIAGATSSWSDIETGNSWPGELVSLGSVPVQPSREGVIVEWRVHVGERVTAGEVLGTLSAPPQMPDALAMLADEEKMATMARVNLDAKRTYTAERIKQLEALRENTERSFLESQRILGTNSTDVASGNFSMIEAKKATLRAMLRGTLAKNYEMLSGQATLPTRWTDVTLKDGIGIQNSKLRDQYQTVLFAALDDINAPNKLPIESGLAYFELVIQLVDASIPDNSMLMASDITQLKTMLHMEQEKFIMAIDELRKAELMASETEKMTFEDLRMIDNDIAMLKQDLAMLEGDLAAKEASARAVKNAVAGSTWIVAPKGGIVSSIMKKSGEYVMPGTPVAMVTGGGDSDLIVRFRVPVNAKKPLVGETLSVMRTGFPDAPKTARLIGIGNALDEGGAIMADAVVADSTDWPIGAAVRVLAPSEIGAIVVNLSSLWWDATNMPNVWAISPAGRIYAKPLTLGRTIGESVEVNSGLVRGEHYVEMPVPGITEDMLISDIAASQQKETSGSSYEEAMRAMGHEM